MTKQVRWKCPSCNSGVLNSSRPRMNDVKRYCLPCSAKSGVLVQRTAPALEKQRDASKTKQVAKQTAKRKKESAIKKKQAEKTKAQQAIWREQRLTAERQKKIAKAELNWIGDLNIPKEAVRLWKLLEPYHRGRALPPIEIRNNNYRGNLGWAHVGQSWRGIVVKKQGSEFSTWTLLLHELTHMAVGVRYPKGRNGRCSAHDETFYKAMKDVTERRWKTRISFYEVTKYGYNVDGIIGSQLYKQGVVKFPPRYKTKKQITEEVA